MKHDTDLFRALECIEDLLDKAEFISQTYGVTDLGIAQVRERLLVIANEHLEATE